EAGSLPRVGRFCVRRRGRLPDRRRGHGHFGRGRLSLVAESRGRQGSTGKQLEPSMASKKTVIVTGASQGIGAAVVQAFLGLRYNVIATSRSVSKAAFAKLPNLALVDGDIGKGATAEKVAQTAIGTFGSIDHLVNKAAIFSSKPFTNYSGEESR